MIALRSLSKSYAVNAGRKTVCRDISLTFPGKTSVGLLGRNGAGKSTLLRMLAGVEDADSGEILSDGTISWPVGFAGSFHPELTGAQNIRFIGRLYGVDTDDLMRFVEDFAELGLHFHAPFRTYSAGMRARLAFGLSMGIEFDTYLIDEVTSVGDAAFRDRSTEMLNLRLARSAAIVVTHSMPLMRQLCTCGVVMVNGSARMYDTIDEAIAVHERAMRGDLPDWAGADG
ncbi:ABC transporter ATP-binding protein [Sinisalibacter aestuarii]|uniref:ATP-binding protein n=1 Tax=Sinisalibacter aestuarii TaxID=2949426 RepID=A0ABQ5LUG0_9RHOB|nr:ABC transporter ATP-binding protein [Sinisalibacter aestuarii]GKY88624.1 ATP-binding protein [Sinisalibacter aestuarii]